MYVANLNDQARSCAAAHRHLGSPADFQRGENSLRFWAFVYKPGTDLMEWREYTRDILLNQLTAQALGNYHVNGWVRSGLTRRQAVLQILRRISISNDLFDSEVQAVQAAWREWWERHGESVRIAATTTPMKTQ